MKILLLLSLLVVSADAFAQAPAPAPTQPRPAAPAQPKPTPPQTPPPQTTPPPTTPPKTTPPAQPRTRPAQPRAEADNGRAGVAMVVTDMRGATLSDIHVELSGPTTRMGNTNDGGQVNFPGLQAGTYRLRFSADTVTPFEREVTLRGGQVANLDITLTAAPPPREVKVPVPAPAPTAAAIGPAGQPQATSIIDLAEKELASKQPRRETLVACSGSSRTTLVLLSQDQPQRLYESAETSYYVVAGQGNIRMASRESTLTAGAFVSIPRGVPFTITRRGNRPLVLLAVLSGEPCEEAK
jgi:mannose-6-phosphate isomerase-like protein (cupin superfamily)